MPTYEYICDACGEEFEKFQSITAEPIKVCPNCGKEEARRKISGGAGIIFKGGGFYETDYRSENYNAAKKKDAEGSGGKAETKAEPAKSAEPAKADTAPNVAPKPEAPKPAASPAPAPAGKSAAT